MGENSVLVHNWCGEFDNYESIKAAYKDDGGVKALKKAKPKHSPNIRKWFKKGGTIEISESGTWTYKMKKNGQVYSGKYTSAGHVTFSDNCLYPDDPKISIGSFSGNRAKDKRAYLNIANDAGIYEIPRGYELHHGDYSSGEMLLVEKYWHRIFSHAGGHSEAK